MSAPSPLLGTISRLESMALLGDEKEAIEVVSRGFRGGGKLVGMAS